MEMNDFINVIGLLAMVITWFIVSPLNKSIEGLQKAVDNLSKSLEERRKEMTALGERVAAGETAIETNTNRLTHLEEEFHSFCNNCKCRKD
ncbi:MAG: hypothetical protein IJZ69_04215 [Bacteroidales bacterium]|nr:hypothetical protein [Bacteroidales bacterium]